MSMWISNTAIIFMLLPITLAILQYIVNKKLTVAMLLGITYTSRSLRAGFKAIYTALTIFDLALLSLKHWAPVNSRLA